MRECKALEELIGPYLYGDLDEAEQAGVEAHLAAHPECRRLVAETRQALAAVPTRDPTEQELDQILLGTHAAIEALRPARGTRLRLLAAAGAVLLLLAGAIYLWPHLRPGPHVVVGPRQAPRPEVVQRGPVQPKRTPESARKPGPLRQPAIPQQKPTHRPAAPLQKIPTPAPLPAPEAGPSALAWLGEIVGKPQVCRAASALWLPAESKQPIAPGDQVRTGGNDRITVGLADGTRLALQPGTTLQLLAAKGRPAQARLISGQVETWVAPAAAPFRVSTPQGRAEATGTRFAVDTSRELTTVAVFDGRVVLANDQGRVALDPRSQVTVRAGEAPAQPVALERGPMINGAAGVVTDNFDGPILNRSLWILRNVDPGIQPVQKDGVLRLQGSTTGTGLRLDSGLATNYWPRQSFSISVEVMVPSESEVGPVLQLFDNSSGEDFRFTFAPNQGYATSGHAWSGETNFTTRQPFGDEATRFHTMRITYDADTSVCAADVDGQPVGSLRFRPEWFYLFLGVPLTEKSHAVDVVFDNFRMDLRGSLTLPRMEAPSQAPLAQHYPSPVLWLGPPDSWESVAVWAPYVIKQKDRYLTYYAGAQLTGGWMWSQVGLATSTDGIHWEKYAHNPVLTDAGEPCVLYDDFGEGRGPYYKMYYREYLKESRDKSVIALATSPDGLNWTRRGTVLGLEPSGERISCPNVLYQADGGATGDRYLLYYYTKEFTGDNWRIGVFLATSNDGVHFERRGPMVINGSRTSVDGLGIGEGQVLRIGGVYHMWFPAKSYDPRWRGSIAHAVSPDGFHWTKILDPLVLQGSGEPGDVFYAVNGLTVLEESGTLRLWFGTMPYELHGAWESLIGYAEYRLPP